MAIDLKATTSIPSAVRDAVGLPISVKLYGAVGNGTTDDTTAIQNAITAAAGGTVWFPEGTYKVTSALTAVDGVTLRGVGYGSLIQAGAGTNNVLLNISGKYDITVEGLGFDGRKATGNAENVVKVTGSSENITLRNLTCINAGYAAISVQGSAAKVTIEDVKASAGVVGIQLATCSDVKVTDVHVSGSTTTSASEGGIYLSGTSRARFTNCSSRSNAGHGLWVGGASDDIRFTNCEFSSNGTAGNDHRGVTVDNTATVTFVNCVAKANIECGFFATISTRTRFVGCDAEGNNTDNRAGGHGFEILGRGTLDGCRSAGNLGNAANEGCGYYVAGPASLTDCDAETNYSCGIRLYDASNVNIKGGIVRNNSQRTAGGHSGIQIEGATATTHVTITGVRAYDDQGTETQEYGIAVSAVVDYYTITGCDLDDNRTGGLSDAGGTNKVIGDNLGTTLTSTASLLASKHSATGSAVATTSGTFADIDATEQAVTFIVPVSGAVLIRATARVNIDSGNSYDWNLREGGSDISGTNQVIIYHDAGGTVQPKVTATWKLTGLTPGASKTYKLGHARSFGSGNVDIRRGAAEPVTLEVWSA